MEGYRLFYEDPQAALRNAIENNVHGYEFKKIACLVYPNLKPESAYARLKAVIHPEKDEKADLWEVKQICSVCGRYEPLYWLCDELEHARPVSRAPLDKAQELVTEFNRGVQELKILAARIERLGGPALQAIQGSKP